MGIFTKLSATLKAADASLDQLRSALSTAHLAESEQSAEVERLGAEKRALLTASDAERSRNRNSLAEARDRLEDARLYREELDRRIASVELVEDQARRRAAYEEAKGKADAAAKMLLREYPAACQKIVAVLRALGEAEAGVAAVNAALPVGTEPLTSPEFTVRATPMLPRQIIKQEQVERWCPQGWERPIDEEYQPTIRPNPDGTGSRMNGQGAIYDRRPFRRVEFLPEVYSTAPQPLAIGLRLPGLFGAPDVWAGGGVGAWMSGWGIDLGAVQTAEAAVAAKRSPEPRRVSTVEFQNIQEEG